MLSLTKSPLVERVVIINQEPVHLNIPRCRVLAAGSLRSKETLSLILCGIRTKYLLLFLRSQQISTEPKALEKIVGELTSRKQAWSIRISIREANTGRLFTYLIIINWEASAMILTSAL